jgi:hypothetical protein
MYYQRIGISEATNERGQTLLNRPLISTEPASIGKMGRH